MFAVLIRTVYTSYIYKSHLFTDIYLLYYHDFHSVSLFLKDFCHSSSNNQDFQLNNLLLLYCRYLCNIPVPCFYHDFNVEARDQYVEAPPLYLQVMCVCAVSAVSLLVVY